MPSYFEKELKKLDIKPAEYLHIMRLIAEKAGYEPNDLMFSSKAAKKLEYKGVHFGNSENADFVIYWLTEGQEKAMEEREQYLARATKIRGDWKKDPLSPNNLAIRIIWAGDMK